MSGDSSSRHREGCRSRACGDRHRSGHDCRPAAARQGHDRGTQFGLVLDLHRPDGGIPSYHRSWAHCDRDQQTVNHREDGSLSRPECCRNRGIGWRIDAGCRYRKGRGCLPRRHGHRSGNCGHRIVARKADGIACLPSRSTQRDGSCRGRTIENCSWVQRQRDYRCRHDREARRLRHRARCCSDKRYRLSRHRTRSYGEGRGGLTACHRDSRRN